MLLDGPQPCLAGWSPSEIITAVGLAINSVLVGWLTYARVQKDKKDTERWSSASIICPAAPEGLTQTKIDGREHKRSS